MATPDELRTALAEARDDLAGALRAADGSAWERAPESGEGEAAWSQTQHPSRSPP